jgi:hypothetical protein
MKFFIQNHENHENKMFFAFLWCLGNPFQMKLIKHNLIIIFRFASMSEQELFLWKGVLVKNSTSMELANSSM